MKKKIMSLFIALAVLFSVAPASFAAEPDAAGLYVLMNIPYAAFYEAEGVSGVDVVSSSTIKTYNQTMAGGSYHDGYLTDEETAKAAGNAKILGITYPVYVEDASVLASYTKVEDSDTAEISVASGKSALTTKEVSGKDLLFASGDYAYYVLSDVPASYKTLKVEDGKVSFSAVSAEAIAVSGLTADLTYGGHYTDIDMNVADPDGVLANATVNAIIVTTKDGQKYALRHVEDIWRKTDLGWNWDKLDGTGLSGQNITNITYYVETAGQYAVYSYDTDIAIKNNPGVEVTAAFANTEVVRVYGLPEDIANPTATVASVVGRGQQAVVLAENVPVQDGKITLTDAAEFGTNYKVTITSDNYADLTAQTPLESLYILMNIPYAAFYEAEGVSGVDVVSSSTIKTYNQGMAGGSYHKGYLTDEETAKVAGNAKILGITYPVQIKDLGVLAAYTEVKDSDTEEISVASGKSALVTKEVSGKDLLFASGDYAYYVLADIPASYKTLQAEDGKVSFSAVSAEAKAVTGLTADLTYRAHYTDIGLNVADPDGVLANATVNAIIVTTKDGQKYALRHVEDIWKKTELGWNWDKLDGTGLSGQTIANITYYVEAAGQYAVYSYDTDIAIKKNAGTEVSSAFTSAAEITVSGLPEDIANPTATVASVVGRGQQPVVLAENVPVQDGKITLTDAAEFGTDYKVTIVSDNYADLSATVTYNVMSSVSIGGVTYFYADTTGVADTLEYQGIVKNRQGSTAYNFTKADLTPVGETNYYYAVVPGTEPLTGTLYGYGEGTATNYKEVYAALGVTADDSYDVISSATNYTSHHAGDIPSNVVYGTDKDGNKAITGLQLARKIKTVDAAAYVEASILSAAGKELSDAQKEALGTALRVNPTKAPAEKAIPVALKSITYKLSKYDAGEFAIQPDDTVEGYVWSEYWDSIYAATISDGTTTVGAVHWIDLYGEKATSGGHYNTVEFELNNGRVSDKNPNDAYVARYASFFDKDGKLKAGTYTVTIYAEGYENLTAEYTVEQPAKQASAIVLKAKTATYNGKAVAANKATVTGSTGKVTYTYYSDKACKKVIKAAAVKNAGTYYVKASVEADDNYEAAVSSAATITIKKAAQPMKLKKTKGTKSLKASALKKKAQSFSLIKFSKKAKGTVTYAKKSGSKNITVNKKTGKITVKKGTKKGTYKAVIKVKANGKTNYQTLTKTYTVTVKVK